MSPLLMCSFIVFDLYYFREKDFKVSMVAHGFSVLLGGIQILLIIASLAMKNHQINDVIEDLRKIIEKRERLIVNLSNCPEMLMVKQYNTRKTFRIRQDAIYSLQSAETYTKIEQLYTLITSVIVKVSIFFTIFVFAGPATFPIVYAFVQYPSPDCWYLPLGYR